MLTLKPSDFRPAYKNQVNFDHPHKNQVNRSHTNYNQFSARTQEPSQFGPPHKKQVKFDTHAKTKSISIPYAKDKLISTSTLMSSQFRSPL